jgi:hypothetical protein
MAGSVDPAGRLRETEEMIRVTSDNANNAADQKWEQPNG